MNGEFGWKWSWPIKAFSSGRAEEEGPQFQ